MEDLIDKRNKKEKIARSIIKSWNVHYITEEELQAKRDQEEQQQRQEEEKRRQEEQQRASEVLNRLKEEAAADEAAKQAEIQALLEQQALYNPTTKSHSGAYGRQKVEDEDALAQINAILGEKEEAFEQQLQNIMDEEKE